MVVPYLASDSLSRVAGRWAEQMNAEAAAAKQHGLRYGYHNHAHEFTTDLGGGVTPWDVLTTELDPKLVHLEVDLYWVVTGGLNSGAGAPTRSSSRSTRSRRPRRRSGSTTSRTGTPVAPATRADLGTGFIDFDRIFAAHTVEEYIVENDSPDVTPLQTARGGLLLPAQPAVLTR